MSHRHPNILVSICCITYNHAQFIKKALDGFLMQQPPSCVLKSAEMSEWCEILIHDDASTDGTDDIVREYAAKYPDKIFPLYEEVNQYTHGGAGKMDLYNYNRARGKYIAYCEGDDYWTDPNKLQKQVDFMETHPDYSVCWHRCIQRIVQTNQMYDDECGKILPNDADGMDLNLDTYFAGWYTQPLTMLFRNGAFDFQWRGRYKCYRDMHEMYHLLKAGKGYLFAFIGGVRNVHEGGIASMISIQKQYIVSYNIARELYTINKDAYSKAFYVQTLQWLVQDDKNLSLLQKISYIHQLLWLSGNLKRYAINLRNFFRKI